MSPSKSFNQAEQVARDLTYSKEQPVDTEQIFQTPPDPVKAVAAATGPLKSVRLCRLMLSNPRASRACSC